MTLWFNRIIHTWFKLTQKQNTIALRGNPNRIVENYLDMLNLSPDRKDKSISNIVCWNSPSI